MILTMENIGKEFCQQFRILPEPDGNDRCNIWFSENSDLSILNYVKTITGRNLHLKHLPDNELGMKILSGFNTGDGEQDGSDETASHTLDTPELIQDSAVVQEINSIIAGAIRDGASDVHFEPFERTMACRIRVDGVLLTKSGIDRDRVPEVISRIKIMSGLDIAEKRRPQDGRIRFDCDGRTVDIRVSVIPTDFGEKAVLRLLDKASLRLDLGVLGFTDSQLSLFKEGISSPHGIILVTGPTGSGKTTTLYSALDCLKSPGVNISTVEDPIEYNLDGINQTQVKPEIGVTFASMLRSLLRQDPNIIMVGEIRDRETLDIAIRASLTGHLVLSTLHTNNAVASITRLMDMGTEPLLLSSSLKMIVAQRLVRKSCRNCLDSTLSENNKLAAAKLGIPLTPDMKNSTGCDICTETGYKGRTSIYEVLPVSEAVRGAITARRSEEEILSLARSEGYLTMPQIAADVIAEGITTPTEVLREISN